MSDLRPSLQDLMAEFAAEERDRLPTVSLREFLAHGEGRLDGERAEAVREWLAADPRCSHLMLEFKRTTRAEDPSTEPSEFEIEQEWRAFETSLDPEEENRDGGRFRWAGAAAMLVLAVLGWGLYLMSLRIVPSGWDDNVVFEELDPDVLRTGDQPKTEMGGGPGFVVLKLLLPPSIDLERPIPDEVDYELRRLGTMVRQGRLRLQDEEDFVLLLPRDLLSPGEHSIRLFAAMTAGQPSATIADYRFQVSGSS